MDQKIKELFKSSKKIKLDIGEKNRIRDHLLIYLRNHPTQNLKPKIFSAWFLNPLPKLAGTFAVFLTLTGVTAMAAENSLPGEFLHPVKVGINENIRSFLTRSAADKADWEIERANRRLVEIEKLADSGKLETKSVKEAKERFEAHLQKASDVIVKTEIKENSEIKSTIGALLLVHQDVLDQIEQEFQENKVKEEVKKELKEFQEDVEEKLEDWNEELSEEKEKAVENQQIAQSAAQGKLLAAENKIKEVRKFIDIKKNKVKDNIILESERLLAEAQNSIDEGKAKMNFENNNDAFALFQRAMLLAQTSQRSLNVSWNIFPPSSLNIKEKIKTEGEENEFKIRIDYSQKEAKTKEKE